eukprot:gene886-413_t
MSRGVSNLVASGGLVWYSDAVFLQSEMHSATQNDTLESAQTSVPVFSAPAPMFTIGKAITGSARGKPKPRGARKKSQKTKDRVDKFGHDLDSLKTSADSQTFIFGRANPEAQKSAEDGVAPVFTFGQQDAAQSDTLESAQTSVPVFGASVPTFTIAKEQPSEIFQRSGQNFSEFGGAAQSDKADGGASDDDFDVQDFDNLQLVEESSSVFVEHDDDDDDSVIQHPYFSIENIANETQEENVKDIPDDISDTTTSAPVCKPLPSGHIVQVTKQIPDDTESVFTRLSKYDQKEKNFDETHVYGEGVNELFTACRSGDRGVVRRLLENPSTQNGINKVMAEQDKEANKLRFGFNSEATTDGTTTVGLWTYKSITPLLVACINNHVGVVQELLACNKLNVHQQTNEGNTALFAACHEAKSEVGRVLLGHFAIDVNLCAVASKRSPSMRVVDCPPREADGHLEVVRCLLSHPKITVNQPNKWGETALCTACWWNSADMVRLLLGHPRIDVNVTDGEGRTLLEMVKRRNCTDIVQILEDHLAKSQC